MLSKQALRDSFALALANGLLMRYQEVPSAAFLAKEFNLRIGQRNAQLSKTNMKNQEVFIETTQSIKESLQVLMMEINHLEQTLAQKK